MNEYSPEGYPNPRKYPKAARRLALLVKARLDKEAHLALKGKQLLAKLVRALQND